jgi:cytochrome c oxidase subunit 2
MINFYNVLESSKWQINFQDPATPIAGRIIEIHNHVFFFLLVILIFVSWMLFRIFNSFWAHNVTDRFSPTTQGVQNIMNYWEIRRLFGLSSLKLTHNTTIEIIWTLIPSFILVAIAIPSFGLLYAMDDIIDPEITLKTIGHQWYWSYEYSDYVSLGKKISFDSYMIPEAELALGQLRLLEVDNSVVLPLGVYIRLNVTAADVLHSWAVPSLGIKIDAVPHRINSGIIFLQRTGVFYGQCSEICGVNHGFMPIVVKSVTINKYLEWLNNSGEEFVE